MKLLFKTTFILLVSMFSASAQVGVNTTGNAPATSAGLDVDFTNKGVLIPRVALTSILDVATIATPANSILVYNTATAGVAPSNVTPGFYYYDTAQAKWIRIDSGGLAWKLTGNAGTVDGTNFIGTTDNVPLNFRVNNQKAGRISSENTFYGIQSGNSITSGVSNTGVGVGSLQQCTTGSNNVASGQQALFKNTNGSYNHAIGYRALYNNLGGYYSIAIGREALLNSVSGENIGVGDRVMFNNTSGFLNTCFGSYSLHNNVVGNYNTAIGYEALYGTLGENNIGIGYNAAVPSAAGSNQVRIGNGSISYAGIQVAWTTTSDRRWKEDIKESNLGLEFITKLKPVSYTRINQEVKKREYGFIAQELEQTLNESGASDNGIITVGDDGMYGVRYNDLMAPMVKAIQELNTEKNDLQNQVDHLEKELLEMKAMLLKLSEKQ